MTDWRILQSSPSFPTDGQEFVVLTPHPEEREVTVTYERRSLRHHTGLRSHFMDRDGQAVLAQCWRPL